MSESLFTIILESLWLFLPAGIANVLPVLAARFDWLPSLNRPIDGGKTFKGKRILGDHKTIRGFVIGIIFGSITGYIQHLLFAFPWAQSLSLVDYSSPWNSLLLGGLIGFGALLGDAAKSFFKRQLNIAPGKPWRPWDQIDLILGALLVTIWFVPLTFAHVTIIIIATFFISFLTSIVGVAIKLKKSV